MAYLQIKKRELKGMQVCDIMQSDFNSEEVLLGLRYWHSSIFPPPKTMPLPKSIPQPKMYFPIKKESPYHPFPPFPTTICFIYKNFILHFSNS